jgi:alkylhydroperoxidase family enzyme
MALLPYGDENNLSLGVLKILANRNPKLNVQRMLANSEALLQAVLELSNALIDNADLDPKLREIAICRTAKVTRSAYEWTHHAPAALYVGVTQEQVEALENWKSSKCFNELERLVLQFTDEVTIDVKGKPETLEALKKYLSPREIIELIMTIAFWGMVARFLETVEIDAEPTAGKINIYTGEAT